jgi:hypothetical protein
MGIRHSGDGDTGMSMTKGLDKSLYRSGGSVYNSEPIIHITLPEQHIPLPGHVEGSKDRGKQGAYKDVRKDHTHTDTHGDAVLLGEGDGCAMVPVRRHHKHVVHE